MNKHMKMLRIAVFSLIVLIAILVLNKNVSINAAENNVEGWKLYWKANDSYIISVDKAVKYGDNPYSVKIENTDYNFAGIEKSFKLKPNTQYRISVSTKYSGYQGKKDEEKWGKGAQIRVCFPNKDDATLISSSYNSEKWGSIIYNFTTDNTGESTIRLCNGGYCKGTAWFGDFRLEEVTETTNQWNILVLIIKSIDADVIVNGESSHYSGSYTKEDIDFLKQEVPKELKKQLPLVSDGLIGVNDLDIYLADIVLDEVNKNDPNAIDPYNKILSEEIEKYLEKKQYQQIIVIPPFEYGINTWQGKGGSKYKEINFCQYIYYSGWKCFVHGKGYKDYQVSGIIHEILHGVERDSMAIDGDKTPVFHENVGIYKDYYNDETDGWFSYHHDYITDNLPDGRGINQAVLQRPSMYLLISDDMTLSEEFTDSSLLPIHISKVITVSQPKAVTYKGKAVKPSIKVKGAEEGKDYTISYEANNDIGKGKIIISGVGKYTGAIELPFTIKMKKTSLKLSGSKLKWGKVQGADGYEVYYSKNGGKFKKLADLGKNQYNMNKLKKGSYVFKIRAYSRSNCGLIYGDWTNEIKVDLK